MSESENIDMLTAEGLKSIRKNLELTQAELASAIGVSKNYIYQLEHGRKISPLIVEKINELQKSETLPREWTSSGYVFAQKPSQRVGESLTLNWSSRIEFRVEVSLSENAPMSPDEDGYFSSSDTNEVFVSPIDFSKYEKQKIETNTFCFYDQDDVVNFVCENTLLIKDILINGNILIIQCAQIELPMREIYEPYFKISLRKLCPEEAHLAAEIVSGRYSTWSKKRWKQPLPKMVFNGVETGIFRSYVYILESKESKRIVSYLDIKQRLDGHLELGTVVSAIQFGGCGLAKSLMLIARIKYYTSSFWIGTSQKNQGMLGLIKRLKHFRPFLFKDDQGHTGHRVLERIEIDRDGNEELMESLYFWSPSLAEIVKENLKQLPLEKI